MSAPANPDPREGKPVISDQALLEAHEKAIGPQPDDRAHYRLLPLTVLFAMSGFILFAATYLNRYSGHFDAGVFDENRLPASGAPVEVKVDPAVLGKKIFNTNSWCVTCHQATGQGIPGVYPPLAGSEWVNGADARIIRILLGGLKGPIKVEGKEFGSAAMPSFGPAGFNLSDERIAAVLTYVRQEWGNKAPPVDAARVAQIRQQIGDHKEWTQEELLQVKP